MISSVQPNDTSGTTTSSSLSLLQEDETFLQAQARVWLQAVLDTSLPEEPQLPELLADGSILMQVAEVAKRALHAPSSASDSDASTAPNAAATAASAASVSLSSNGPPPSAQKRLSSTGFAAFSHIDKFLKACREAGLTDLHLFSAPDLFEQKDLRRVYLCLRALSKALPQLPDFDTLPVPRMQLRGAEEMEDGTASSSGREGKKQSKWDEVLRPLTPSGRILGGGRKVEETKRILMERFHEELPAERSAAALVGAAATVWKAKAQSRVQGEEREQQQQQPQQQQGDQGQRLQERAKDPEQSQNLSKEKQTDVLSLWEHEPSSKDQEGRWSKEDGRDSEGESDFSDDFEDGPSGAPLFRVLVAVGAVACAAAFAVIQISGIRGRRYQVKKGDTLVQISKAQGKKSWKELAKMNPQIQDPNLIYPNTVVKVEL